MTNVSEAAVNGRGALSHAELSDVGLRRSNNQDSYTVALAGDEQDWVRRGHLFMVADGMGAHAAGELASKIACEAIPHTYRKLLDRPPHEALQQAIIAANESIHQRGQANAEFQGMGTTCTVLVLLPGSALVGHVGDSRAYRLRQNKLEQLSFDHSLVWEMMAAGQMPVGEAATFIPKNIITRSLGPHADVHVDLEGPYPLEVGDTFLLCSDGLSGQVKDEEIGDILGVLSPEEAARVLIDISNLRGGPDNITVLIARVLAIPAEAGEQPQPKPIANDAAAGGNSALWVVMAICLLIALGLAFTGLLVAALVSGLLAAGTAVLALVLDLTKTSTPAAVTSDQPLGKGPHTVLACVPSAESAVAFAQMAQQLREAAKEEHWTLDWVRFNGHGERAQAAVTAGDFAHAVREYALAISFIMSEIRHQPARNVRDNSVLDR